MQLTVFPNNHFFTAYDLLVSEVEAASPSFGFVESLTSAIEEFLTDHALGQKWLLSGARVTDFVISNTTGRHTSFRLSFPDSSYYYFYIIHELVPTIQRVIPMDDTDSNNIRDRRKY